MKIEFDPPEEIHPWNLYVEPKDGLIWISNKQTTTSFLLFLSMLSYKYLPEQVNSLGANINEKFHSWIHYFGDDITSTRIIPIDENTIFYLYGK